MEIIGEQGYFAPDEVKENDKPIAEVWFHGEGKRWGPLRNYGTSRIVCTFADRKQMEEYIDLRTRQMPKSITYQGVAYKAVDGGQYQSGDGNILPYLLVMYFLLSPSEQEAFTNQNPEVQGLLGDAENFTATDGASEDFTGSEFVESGECSVDTGSSTGDGFGGMGGFGL